MQAAFLVDFQAPSKTIGVVLHDPELGRLVYKGDPQTEIYRAFTHGLERLEGGVVQVGRRGSSFVRKKVPTSDPAFLALFLGSVVRYPYRISEMRALPRGCRIDTMADRIAAEVLRT
jgi:hypothetical protein